MFFVVLFFFGFRFHVLSLLLLLLLLCCLLPSSILPILFGNGRSVATTQFITDTTLFGSSIHKGHGTVEQNSIKRPPQRADPPMFRIALLNVSKPAQRLHSLCLYLSISNSLRCSTMWEYMSLSNARNKQKQQQKRKKKRRKISTTTKERIEPQRNEQTFFLPKRQYLFIYCCPIKYVFSEIMHFMFGQSEFCIQFHLERWMNHDRERERVNTEQSHFLWQFFVA